MSLGERIKNYRKKKSLSQENLAEKIGVSRQAVSKWESNKSVPSTENLIILTEILDISMNDLTADNPISKSNKMNRKGIEIGYALSGVAAAFYYSHGTDLTFLIRAYVTLAIIGSIILLGFTLISYSQKTRTKVLASNLIYLIIINILGILTNVYGGIIAFILIIIAIFLYDNFLKRFQLKN